MAEQIALNTAVAAPPATTATAAGLITTNTVPAAPAAKPEYIEDKFWDKDKGIVRTEDLAKSYKELQAKQSTTTPSAPPAPVAPPAEVPAAPPAKSEAEQKAEGIVAEKFVETVRAIAGTTDQYKALTAWGAANLKAEEFATFNALVSGNDVEMAKTAVTALKARFEQSEGRESLLIVGTTAGVSAQTDVYANSDETVTDMRDPRYSSSETYRAAVKAKVLRSTLFGIPGSRR